MRVAIVEDHGLVEEGLSAANGAVLDVPHEFYRARTANEFKARLAAAVAHVADSPDGRALLIISAHGVPGTATRLKIGTDQVEPTDLIEAFKQLPPSAVVFLSACWGAYPMLLASVRAYRDVGPLVIGATVQIDADDACALQDDVLGAVQASDRVHQDCIAHVRGAAVACAENYACEAAFRYHADECVWPEHLGGEFSGVRVAQRFTVTEVLERERRPRIEIRPGHEAPLVRQRHDGSSVPDDGILRELRLTDARGNSYESPHDFYTLILDASERASKPLLGFTFDATVRVVAAADERRRIMQTDVLNGESLSHAGRVHRVS